MPKRPTKDPRFAELKQDIDLEQFAASVKEAFQDTDDPRQVAKTRYPFWFLMLLFLCGYLSGCNTVSDLAIYAELNTGWINMLIGQTFSAPSYDTLWWLLARLPPATFKQLLQKWFAHIPQQFRDQLLIIDGKRLKGVSTDENLVHLVELFASEQRLMLAQEKVPDKSSEPKVIEALLKDVDVSGALIATDALFAHTARAQQFLDHGADYLIGLDRVLDVVFREDAAQAKAGFIAENMAFFRRLSMNIIKTVDPGRGFADARRCCTYEQNYLRGILGKIFVG